METITLPIWALATAVGLPGISLLWIIIALLRRRRNAMKMATAPEMKNHSVIQPQDTSQFRDDLLAQQIDIVFNGLTALIETERIKLSTLLKQGAPASSVSQAPPTASGHHNDMEAGIVSHEKDTGALIGQQVAKAIAAGQGVDGAAAQLGLSHAEVNLAMKLNQSQSEGAYRKLEAVA